jgi:YihY family inner membrane protein
VLARLVAWFDGFQRRHAWLGFPLAVRQKYSDDQGAYLGATITYYGFFAIFPLLLVMTTVLGYVLADNPSLAKKIEDSALAQFPVIGNDLKTGSLTGSPLAVLIGTVTALWAGMGAILAAENALNKIWGVPRVDRPSFVHARLRALGLLAVVGGGLIGATVLTSLVGAVTSFAAWRVASVLLSTGLAFVVFWSMLRILISADVAWGQLCAGAAVAAVGYELLQLLGSYYIERVVQHASNTYGTFALVIGLLSFIYLAVFIFLMGAEVSVVLANKLWPRSFSVISEQPPTPADVAALEQRATAEVRRRDEEVAVSISGRRGKPVLDEPRLDDAEPRDP